MQDVLSGLPLNSSTFNSSAVSQYGESMAAANSASDASRTQAEKEATSEYVAMTDVMAQMNEAVNANVYIMESLLREAERVLKLDENAKRSIYKIRQDYMYVSYMTEYYTFMTNMVMYTMVITLILLSLTAAWKMGKVPEIIYFILCACIVVVYAVSMFILFKHAAYRRNYQWNKYYWKAGADVRRELNSSSSRQQEPSCDASTS